MSDRKRNILEAVLRIDFFGKANPQLAAEVPYTGELFLANSSNIERLNQAGIVLASSSSVGLSGTRSKMARAEEIEADIRLVAKTARFIEKKDPNFHNTFELPPGSLTYEEIIRHADSYIADAPANKANFDKYALTTAFFTELAARVAGFRVALQEQADGKRESVGATAEQEAAIKVTLETRKELDRVMKNHFRNDPQKLAEWQTASHIRQPDEAGKGETPPPVNG